MLLLHNVDNDFKLQYLLYVLLYAIRLINFNSFDLIFKLISPLLLPRSYQNNLYKTKCEINAATYVQVYF